MIDIEGEVRAARAAYRSRQFAEAMSSCRTILSQDETHHEAHELYALAALGKGDAQHAAEHLLQAVHRQPQAWDLQLFAAAALTRCQRHSQAVEVLEDALRRHPREPRIAFQLAVTLQSGGQLDEAIGRYRQALRLTPNSAEIYNNLATALSQRGDHEAAVEALTAALRLDPHYVRALNNLGKVLQELRRPEDAIGPLQRALAAAPDSAEVRCNLGAALKALGRWDDSMLQYREAIRLNPQLAQAHFNLGNVLLAAQRAEEAIDSLRSAVRLMPQLKQARSALASAYFMANRFEESAQSLAQALQLDPQDIELRIAMARALRRGEQTSAAVAALREAIARAPQQSQARKELALLLADVGDHFESIALLQSLVDEHPSDVTLRFDFAQVLASAGSSWNSPPHLRRAAEQFEAALALDPQNAVIRMHYGLALQAETGKEAEARAQLEKAVAKDPQLIAAWWQVARFRVEEADWSDYPAMLERMPQLAEATDAGVQPLMMAFLIDDPEAQLRCARQASRALRGSGGLLPARGPKSSRGPLRVAYLSPDFRAHPVGMSIVELLERHDTRRVETIAIAVGPRYDDDYRRRIQQACGQFHDVGELTNAEAARLIRDLGVDIAVDLAGHTTDARPLILQQRPAPINVQYLGYPGSMGMPWVDYVMADRFVIPETQFGNFDESVIWLPESFFPSDTRCVLPDGAPTRGEAGLPDSAVVFCCFNQLMRLGPAQLDSWTRILAAVPDSVLWLRTGNPTAESNVRREAARRGLDPDRIVFAPLVESRAEHLRRHRAADLYLDSFPYNGHSTARDALWAGLPVLTRSGTGFASRVAGSLLTALGLHDLITDDAAAYEAAAIAYGRDWQRLSALKPRLQASSRESVLFDTRRLTAHVEDGYEAIYRRWAAGEPPSSLKIAARPRHD